MTPSDEARLTEESDEISLLDLLLVVTENLRLLIIGPILAGLVALAITFVVPQTFESQAILKGTQQTVSVVSAPVVLDPVISSLKLAGVDEPLDIARQRLRGQLKASFNGKYSTVSISVTGPSPQAAQQLLAEVIKAYYLQSQPRGSEKERLEVALASTADRLREATNSARNLQQRLSQDNPKASADTAQGYAILISAIDALEKKQADLAKELGGVDDSSLIQPPTLNQLRTSPKRAIVAVVATLAALFGLLLWVFARAALASASADPSTSAKLQTIKGYLRRALFLPRSAP